MKQLIGIAAIAAVGVGYGLQNRSAGHYIINGPNAAEVLAYYSVDAQRLELIDAHSAELSRWERSKLVAAGLRMFPDRTLSVSSSHAGSPNIRRENANHTVFSQASEVHQAGLSGYGVTVGIIDTGIDSNVAKSIPGFVAFADVSNDNNVLSIGRKAWKDAQDTFGHGTHMASVVATPTQDPSGVSHGIAPGASLVAIRAFGDSGTATYTDVIEAIEVAIELRGTIGLDVLSLSFGADVQSHYWEDPLNQAVMRAWDAGLVVVTSAGNAGPASGSITVPGNVPYVITVGAASDAGTPNNTQDDFIPSYSAAGPTFEGHVKPELLAPAEDVWGVVDRKSTLADLIGDGRRALSLDGTSVAAATTAGIVALLLEAAPELGPDDVKCRLMMTASAATADDATISIFRQGAGLVSTRAALLSTATGCANRGMNIAADIRGETHFAGPARQAGDGEFYILDDEFAEGVPFAGFRWSGESNFDQDVKDWGGNEPLYAESYPWGGGGNRRSFFSLLWSEGSTWTDDLSFEFAGSGTIRVDSYPWGGGGNMALMYQSPD